MSEVPLYLMSKPPWDHRMALHCTVRSMWGAPPYERGTRVCTSPTLLVLGLLCKSVPRRGPVSQSRGGPIRLEAGLSVSSESGPSIPRQERSSHEKQGAATWVPRSQENATPLGPL